MARAIMARQRVGWSILLVLGLGIATAIGTDFGIAARQEAKPALPADLARVPADAFFVGSVRMADTWNSDAAKGVREQAKKTFPDLFAAFEKELGSVAKPGLGLGSSRSG